MLYTVLILIIFILLYFKSTRNKYSHLPTLPYFVPWLGNLPLLFDKGDPLNHQARLYRKYSKGRKSSQYFYWCQKFFFYLKLIKLINLSFFLSVTKIQIAIMTHNWTIHKNIIRCIWKFQETLLLAFSTAKSFS